MGTRGQATQKTSSKAPGSGKKSKKAAWNKKSAKAGLADVQVKAAERKDRLALEKKVDDGLLFQEDTVGSTKGLPRSVRLKLGQEKKVKGAHRLSRLELKQLETAIAKTKNKEQKKEQR